MRILIKSLGSCPFYGSYMVMPREVGLNPKPFPKWAYEVIDEKLFFLSVIKYGIVFEELQNI